MTKVQITKTLLAISVVALSAGCTNSARFTDAPPPETLTPINNGVVTSNSLPPLSGTQVTTGDQNLLTTPDGQSQFPASDFESQDPLIGSAVATTSDGSIVSLDPTGTPTTAQQRDLSGVLSETKLLGGWTVISGAEQCRINLTQTAKPGTNRYRASAPGCTLGVLGELASWQLAGTQVQFFSESGQLIGTLIQSGNRFLGSLSGGQGISMVG